MRLTSSGFSNQTHEGEKRCLNSELWHACAGPIVSLPIGGNCVVYFPQGHSEQVSASNNKEVDAHIPNYPSLPPQLICQLHDVTMHADAETDEVYAQMTLQPLSPQDQKDAYLSAELDTPSKQPNNYFCKTLTASDTSTHGGFSVPRRAAEKVFPPLDFTQQPPAQELIARDLHDNEWKFRHIFRGQPKRHLLTTGWSIFISAKRLVAGDSVLFIWNEKNQLLLGIRRAHRPQTILPSSVLSSDSMHIGLLAAAAHAATTSSRFTIFYNPRASPSEFVISLAKYAKAVYHTHVSVGMRFRMLFETEEASVRRYMGTITGISDLDPVRWSNSYWRSVKVGWDESTAGERQPRVSLWDIEPLTTFPMYPSPFSLRLKRPWPPGLPFLHGGRDDEMGLKSPLMWLHGDGTDRGMQALNFKDMGVTPWTQPRFDSSLLGLQHEVYQAVGAAALQEMRNVDLSNQVPLGLQPDLYQAMGVEGLQEMRNVVPMKQALPSLLQFQQPHTGPNGCTVLQRQILQQVQSQSPQIFLQNILENQNQAESQLHLIQQLQQQHTFNGKQQHTFNGQQQQLQHHSFNGQQQQLQHTHSFMDQKLQRQQQLQLLDKKQMPTVVTSFSQLASASQSEAPSLKSISSIGYQQLFSGCNGTSMSGLSPLQSILGSFSPGDTAHLHNLPRTSPPIPSSTWLQKEAAVDSLLPSGPHPIGTQMDLLDPSQLNSSHHSMWLPSLPGRECSLDQESGTDPTQSNLLFGVSIDSASLLMQNGISSLRSVGSETDSTSMPFAASNYLDGLGSDFSLNPTTNSSCLGESEIFQSPEHVDQENPPSRTFVKVYKSGSFGRSLDMTKFSSYQELRNELAQMFSLEGQLEDPQRSGWQLVFVDRENDVLLLGDDPWQEFVDNVWCIKILSPQEVQHMVKQGIELLSAVPIQRLASRNCNDHVS